MSVNQNKLNAIIIVALLIGTLPSFLNFVFVRAEDQIYSATLSGSGSGSNANGTAKFEVNENSDKVSYWVALIGIKKITKVDIHDNQSEKPLVILANGKSSNKDESAPIIKLSGNITKSDLLGPLKGKPISELVSLFDNGSSYIDGHTRKYPKGAVRGGINSGDIEMQKMWQPEAMNKSNTG
jgi:CHRD domain